MTKGKPSLIAAVLLTVAAVVVAAAPARPKRVLIIHSYLPAYESGMGDKLRGELTDNY